MSTINVVGAYGYKAVTECVDDTLTRLANYCDVSMRENLDDILRSCLASKIDLVRVCMKKGKLQDMLRSCHIVSPSAILLNICRSYILESVVLDYVDIDHRDEWSRYKEQLIQKKAITWDSVGFLSDYYMSCDDFEQLSGVKVRHLPYDYLNYISKDGRPFVGSLCNYEHELIAYCGSAGHKHNSFDNAAFDKCVLEVFGCPSFEKLAEEGRYIEKMLPGNKVARINEIITRGEGRELKTNNAVCSALERGLVKVNNTPNKWTVIRFNNKNSVANGIVGCTSRTINNERVLFICAIGTNGDTGYEIFTARRWQEYLELDNAFKQDGLHTNVSEEVHKVLLKEGLDGWNQLDFKLEPNALNIDSYGLWVFSAIYDAYWELLRVQQLLCGEDAPEALLYQLATLFDAGSSGSMPSLDRTGGEDREALVKTLVSLGLISAFEHN